MLNRVGDITIEQIIKSRIDFIHHNDVFDKEKFKSYNEGEIIAYHEMLKDIYDYSINDFERKYTDVLQDVETKMEASEANEQVEKMAGYNNAIVFVMELIDPKYKYNL